MRAFSIQKRVIFGVLALSILSVLMWLLIGNHNTKGLIDILFVVGALSAVAGVSARLVSTRGSYEVEHHLYGALNMASRDERFNLFRKDVIQGYWDFYLLFPTGIIIMSLGGFIYVFF